MHRLATLTALTTASAFNALGAEPTPRPAQSRKVVVVARACQVVIVSYPHEVSTLIETAAKSH